MFALREMLRHSAKAGMTVIGISRFVNNLSSPIEGEETIILFSLDYAAFL